MAVTGDYAHSLYDFVEVGLSADVHENFEDIIEHKIFKYKYRLCNDTDEAYLRRNNRMISRHIDRAYNRDPLIEQNLFDLFSTNDLSNHTGARILDLIEGRDIVDTVRDQTLSLRQYMMTEAIQQYSDYYETDYEEGGFKEYLDAMGEREKIRFAEIFEDFTVNRNYQDKYVTIDKRENNPELSYAGNLILDLIDFKDRVRHQAKDAALLDLAVRHQRKSAKELDSSYADVLKELDSMREALPEDEKLLTSEETVKEEEEEWEDKIE